MHRALSQRHREGLRQRAGKSETRLGTEALEGHMACGGLEARAAVQRRAEHVQKRAIVGPEERTSSLGPGRVWKKGVVRDEDSGERVRDLSRRD